MKTKEETITWLLDRMKRRAQGRARIKRAKRRMQGKQEKRIGGRVRYHMGIVDDEDFGAAAPRMRLKQAYFTWEEAIDDYYSKKVLRGGGDV